MHCYQVDFCLGFMIAYHSHENTYFGQTLCHKISRNCVTEYLLKLQIVSIDLISWADPEGGTGRLGLPEKSHVAVGFLRNTN